VCAPVETFAQGLDRLRMALDDLRTPTGHA
jgi:hypothetical protein